MAVGLLAAAIAALGALAAQAQEGAKPNTPDRGAESGTTSETDGQADGKTGDPADGKTDGQQDRLTYPYTVELSGIDDEAVAKTARELSALFQEQDRPPATRFGLRRRMQEDAEKLRDYLRSEAYYAVRVSITADHKVKPAKVSIKVELGPRYRLTVFRIVDPKGAALAVAPSLEAIGVELGEPGRSVTIVNAQQRMLAALANRGYPFAEVTRRQVIVDHKPRVVEVTLYLDTGGLTRFGASRLQGLKRAKPGFARRSISWKEGEVYNAEKVRETRRKLLDTGVFASVTIVPQEKERGADGRTPMVLTLGERKPRTIEAGASYSTDLGLGGNVSWIHRNLFGGGERLRLSGDASFDERKALASLTFPYFFSLRQDLTLTTSFAESTFDAYDAIIFGASAIVGRRINRHLRITGGLSFERSVITQDEETERFKLFGVPFALRFDDTDNLLDPTRGTRIHVELTPYTGSGTTGGLFFTRMTGKVSSYWKPWRDRRFVLASWLELGTVVGEPSQDLPANKRLYAGGGGSVRGFGFQRISPLDDNNDPIGGRSLIAFGVEARFRITGNWGGVLFLEGGSVTESVVPDFSQPIRWGTGVGLRYYTSFGPIRLDIGFPLNRRDGDAAFQVYISIGQAF